MLVCQTLDFIFDILGLVNKMPNLSSWDFILVTLGIPTPQTLDFISGNGLDSSRPSSLTAYTDPAQHPAKHLCQTSPPQSGQQPSSLHSSLHSTLHSTLAKLGHKVRHRRPDLWEVRTPIASSYLWKNKILRAMELPSWNEAAWTFASESGKTHCKPPCHSPSLEFARTNC